MYLPDHSSWNGKHHWHYHGQKRIGHGFARHFDYKTCCVCGEFADVKPRLKFKKGARLKRLA